VIGPSGLIAKLKPDVILRDVVFPKSVQVINVVPIEPMLKLLAHMGNMSLLSTSNPWR